MFPDRAAARWFLALLVCAGILALAQNPSPEVQAKIAPLFQSARAAEKRADWASAAKFYDRILALDSQIAEIWTNKGLVLYQLAQHSEALAAFSRAASLKPALVTPQLFLGIEYVRHGEPEKAIGPLEKVLALEPQHAQGVTALAEAYTGAGRFADTVRLYRRILQRDPAMEETWYRLGLTYLKWSEHTARRLVESPSRSGYGDLLLAEFEALAGFREDAEANYRAAITKLPQAPEPHLAFGQFYLESSPPQLSAAGRQFAIAKQITPEDRRVTLALVRLAEAKGDAAVDPSLDQAGIQRNDAAQFIAPASSAKVSTEENVKLAIRLWNRGDFESALAALKPDSTDPATLYWLSLTCRELARQTFEEAVRKNPNSYRAHLLLAEIARAARDLRAARTEFAQAAALGSNNASAQLLYIEFLMSSKEDDEALSVATRAVVNLPGNAELNAALGKLLLASGRTEEAAVSFRRSLEIDPATPKAHAGLADCYAAAGHLDAAVDEMKRALPSDMDGTLHYRLGRWYRQMGRDAEANQAFSETARLKEQVRKAELMHFSLTHEPR